MPPGEIFEKPGFSWGGKWYNDATTHFASEVVPGRTARPRTWQAPVAQWIEHQTSNLGVAGSSPAGRAIFKGVYAFGGALQRLGVTGGLQIAPACMNPRRFTRVSTIKKSVFNG
jgi:hypothetical protein